MSMYADLLRMVLEADPDTPVRSTAELIGDLVVAGRDIRPDQLQDSAVAGPIGDSLAYDAALVRLCRRMNIAEDLTADVSVASARRTVEAALVARLPSLAASIVVAPVRGDRSTERIERR